MVSAITATLPIPDAQPKKKKKSRPENTVFQCSFKSHMENYTSKTICNGEKESWTVSNCVRRKNK